jgi:ferredoxin
MEDISERKIAGLTVRINRNTCIATANCMKVAEDVFEFDEERICAFRSLAVTIDRERLIEACRVCPVDALIVIDEGGQQIVP